MEAHLVVRICIWIVVALPIILCPVVVALMVGEFLQKVLKKNHEKDEFGPEWKSRKQALGSSW